MMHVEPSFVLYALRLDPGFCLRAHAVLSGTVEPVEPEEKKREELGRHTREFVCRVDLAHALPGVPTGKWVGVCAQTLWCADRKGVMVRSRIARVDSAGEHCLGMAGTGHVQYSGPATLTLFVGQLQCIKAPNDAPPPPPPPPTTTRLQQGISRPFAHVSRPHVSGGGRTTSCMTAHHVATPPETCFWWWMPAHRHGADHTGHVMSVWQGIGSR